MPRKRNHDEMASADQPQEAQQPSILQRIRNMWEFASVMQYVFLFGKVVKIDEDFDIEDFETECLKPGHSEKLEEIGLQLLRWISSHRGLNYDIWDEYTRRQYISKAPHLNPYGDDEEPKRFRDFDIFQKIRILHQLTVWTLWNPDRMREKMPDHPREVDQTEWRIEELGYDRDDSQYYLLDDNRLYRRTDPPPPSLPKAKAKYTSLKAQAARRRVSKRRRTQESASPDPMDDDTAESAADTTNEVADTPTAASDTFGGFKWECVAINLKDYQDLCESLRKTRDPNEKILRDRLLEEVIPIIEAAEDRHRRKIERRERDLLALERMASAKRSSRIADKMDREKKEHEVAEAERKRTADLVAAHREQEKQEQMEKERQSRMMTREQRIKDREFKRILMEEELARDAEEQRRIEAGEARGSERHIKERIEKNKKELDGLSAEDEWTFDCSGCGVHGRNIDDGSHSVACERCSVWQHSKCLGISKSAADKDDFHFVCADCKRKEEEAKRPKISLKLRVGPSSSPPQPHDFPPMVKTESPRKQRVVSVDLSGHNPVEHQPTRTNGYSMAASFTDHTIYAAKPSPVQVSPNNQPLNPPYPQQRTGSSPLQSALRLGQTSPPPLQWKPVQNGLQQHQPPTNRLPSHQNQARPFKLPNARQNQPIQPHQNPTSQNHLPTLPRSPPQETSQSPSIRTAPPQQTPNGHTYRQPSSYQNQPSPAANPPLISPTQGNYDVGLVAGIRQQSSTNQSGQIPMTPSTSINGGMTGGNPMASQPRYPLHATPAPSGQSAQRSPPLQLSGLSPVKQRSPPLPPPSHIPQKLSMSASPPPPPASSSRSISGTPIFPPATNFAPRPEQLHSSPVPTPSKNPTPAKIGADELKRISQEVEAAVGGVVDLPRQYPVPGRVSAERSD